jgi:hypothetical protein
VLLPRQQVKPARGRGAAGGMSEPHHQRPRPSTRPMGSAPPLAGSRRGESNLHQAQAPTVLDHSRTLPQGDGCARPAFTRRAVGGECNLIILDAGDVLHDAFAVRGPRIDAESKPSPECGHLRPLLPHSSSRFTVGASDDVAEIVRGLDFPGVWVKHSPPKRLRNASEWQRLGSRIEYRMA